MIANLRRVWATNANTSSFASRIPTITEPTNDGVIAIPGSYMEDRLLRLYPIGLGSDNDVASMRLIGWNKAIKDGSKTLWIPSIIGEFACTFSAAVGIAGATVLNTERFADTITPVSARLPEEVLAAGTAVATGVKIFSPTNDLIAWIELYFTGIWGFEKLEFCFDQTTNMPTCNVLYQFLEK